MLSALPGYFLAHTSYQESQSLFTQMGASGWVNKLQTLQSGDA